MRIETTTRELFQFDELDDKAKERARDWYREASGDDTWWSDAVEDDAKVILGFLGYRVKAIFWSGFRSQGDGACFTGTWHAENCDASKVRDYAPQDEKLHALAADFELLAKSSPEMFATISHTGCYVHANSVSFDCEFAINDESVDSFEIASRALMRWIYGRLETENWYRNSDECVDEDIRANEYEFTADGRRA